MGTDRKNLQQHGIGEWSSSGDFFGAILAGLLLGLLADWLLGTQPWLVVIGVIAGFGVGFWRMIGWSERIMTELDLRRGRQGFGNDEPGFGDDDDE